MFDRDRSVRELPGFCRDLEAAGLDDIWVVEDLSWAGSITTAATALAATERLRVGIGVAPAPLRNPALLAMELATLAELYPGRLVAGIGHGVASWMAQVGAKVTGPLALLSETVSSVRALLAGERISVEGSYVQLREVALTHPPAVPPKVVVGAIRPKSLQLAGRVGDGAVLAEGVGPDAVRAALANVATGRAEGTAHGPAELVVFTHLVVEPDAAELARLTEPIRAEFATVHGIAPAEVALAEGSAAQVAERIEALWAAGADTVVLRPVGEEPMATVRRALTALGRN
jgi:alkanesulfonate monooxygenase SsuD/methylene tetrahydromethanopterin reductase-like flavin-dependent oxidoreductase (luciferase family)